MVSLFSRHARLHLLILVCIVPIIGSCGNRQKPRPAHTPLFPHHTAFKATEAGLSLRVRTLTKEQCVQLFGAKGASLTRNGIQRYRRHSIIPLYFLIRNNSDVAYTISPEDISLPQIDAQTVIHRLQSRITPTIIKSVVACGTIAALIATGGIAAVAVGSTMVMAPLVTAGIITIATTPAILLLGAPTSATISCIREVRANRNIAQTVDQASFQSTIDLKPHSEIEMVIFVRGSSYQRHFTVSLKTPEGLHRLFSVDMHTIHPLPQSK